MSEKSKKLTIANYQEKLSASDAALVAARKDLNEQSLALYEARIENARLSKAVKFLRADRNALVSSIKVLSQEADLEEGRAILIGTVSRSTVDGAKEQVQ